MVDLEANQTICARYASSTPRSMTSSCRWGVPESSSAMDPSTLEALSSQANPKSAAVTTSSTSRSVPAQLGLGIEETERVFGVTDTQAGMIALTELDDETDNATLVIDAAAGLEEAQLRIACEAVIARHPFRRTAFVQVGSALRQVVLKSPPDVMVRVVNTSTQGKTTPLRPYRLLRRTGVRPGP
ncbi:hypothetical protein GGR56DRAFT_648648 [Xylariaceae sp. FL0804]|nr:hypothetical protein GGR56DRAFT_648648 [Xylariaceae sp. FL0804]